MSDMVDACPSCDLTSRIYRRHASKPHGRSVDQDPAWVCRACGTEFDEPNTREAKGSTNGGGGMRSKLLDANPEEWP